MTHVDPAESGGSFAPLPAQPAGPGQPQPRAQTPDAPPGWFPDPMTPGQLRYWDGTTWTGHTAGALTTPYTAPSVTIPGHPLTGVTVGFGLAAACLVAAVGVLNVVLLGVHWWAAVVLNDWHNDPDLIDIDTANTIDALTDSLGWAHVALYVAAAAVSLTWLFRLYGSDRVDAGALHFGRGWMVGSWFVPVLSWWRPLQLVRDLWWGLTPAEQRGYGAGRRPIPGLLMSWWIGYLAMSATSWIQLQQSRRAETLDELFSSMSLSAVSDGVTVAAAVAAVVVYLRLARKAGRPASAATAPPYPSAPVSSNAP